MPHVPAHDFPPFQTLSAFTSKAAMEVPFPDEAMEALPLELHAAHEEWQQWCKTASEDDIAAFFNGRPIGIHPLQHWIFNPPSHGFFQYRGLFHAWGTLPKVIPFGWSLFSRETLPTVWGIILTFWKPMQSAQGKTFGRPSLTTTLPASGP